MLAVRGAVVVRDDGAAVPGGPGCQNLTDDAFSLRAARRTPGEQLNVIADGARSASGELWGRAAFTPPAWALPAAPASFSRVSRRDIGTTSVHHHAHH